MTILVFDIETIPDTEGAKRLHDFEGLSASDIALALFKMQREKTGGSEFLPLYLHRVIAISVLVHNNDKLKLWSLGEPDSSEQDLIQRFYDGIEKYTPTLVSWNGSGFDLPVLHYRSLVNKINAKRYWETGDNDKQFQWNNYLNRYHRRHFDLMDVLAGYQPRANAPLDQIASLLGFPGKMGMAGNKVWDYYCQGDIDSIRNYCETDVLNTYLTYLRFCAISGELNQEQLHTQNENLRNYLIAEKKPHLDTFISHWHNDN